MKKLYTLIIASTLLFTGEKTFAQTFSMSMPDTVQQCAVSSDVQFLGDTLINNTASAIPIRVGRVQNIAFSSWTSDYCLNVCYLPSTDSVSFTLPANSKQNFLMHVNTDPTCGIGTVYMEFRNTLVPSNKLYQRFHISNGNGVNELNAQDVSVKISPNPIITGSTLSINISSTQNSTKIYSLTVYDMVGNAVANYSNLILGNNSISLNASQGIYFYKLVSENQQLSAGKLMVTE